MSSKSKRISIPKVVRDEVWNTHIGQDKAIGNCYVCDKELNIQYYECGHIISVKEDGDNSISNLRPVCSRCNKSVGSQNMDEFKKEYMNHTEYYDVETEINIDKQNIKDTYNMSDFYRNQINIAVIGPISVGKSTFVNTLFVKQYSDMKIKRTTMTPQVYYETDIESIDNAQSEEIRKKNKNINDNLYKKIEHNDEVEYDDIQEIKYYVPKTSKFVQLINKVYFTVYDLPGLNDGHVANSEVYHNWVSNNFYKFDIVICVFDLKSGLNTSDEVKILKDTITNIKNNKDNHNIDTKLCVIVNKCDDMYLDDKGKLKFSDDEHQEMFDQVNQVIANKRDEMYPDLQYDIIRMSSEDAYIYRMYENNPNNDLGMQYMNRFGHNEFGRTSWNKMKEDERREKIKQFMESIKDDIYERMEINGFGDFISKLSKILDRKGQYKFLINHINFSLSEIKGFDKMINEDDLAMFTKIYNRITEINHHMGIDIENNQGITSFNKYINEYMIEYVKLHLEEYLTNINPTNIDMAEKNAEYLSKYCDTFASPYCISVYDKLQDNINEYYSSNIKSRQHTFSKSFEHFKKLVFHKYSKLKELVQSLFENDDILNNDYQYIFNSLNHLHKGGHISTEELDEKLKDVLIKIYKAINSNRVIKYVDKDILPSYVFWAYKYWNNRDILDNKHTELQFWAYKNMVKFINDNNNACINCTNSMLEQYII